MTWRLLIEARPVCPAAALARDEALLRGTVRPTLRLWRNDPCLVLGRFEARLPQLERARAHFARQGIPLLQRPSGGTAVWHGPGVFNVSVVVPAARAPAGVHETFEHLGQGMRRALAELGLSADFGRVPGAYCDGPHNLVCGGKKLAGLAQARRRQAVLVHASLLVSADLEAMHDRLESFYALAGEPQRFERGLTVNLADLLACPLDFPRLVRRFAQGYRALVGPLEPGRLSEEERRWARQLAPHLYSAGPRGGSDLAEGQGGVVPPKAKGVGEHELGRGGTGAVGHHV